MRADERRARDIVRERSGGDCELRIPDSCLGRATNFQHRQNRSQGGSWLPTNGLDVCGTGTTGCHGFIHANPAISYGKGWMVHSYNDPADVPAMLWLGLDYGVVRLTDEGDLVSLTDEERVACIGLGYGVAG